MEEATFSNIKRILREKEKRMKNQEKREMLRQAELYAKVLVESGKVDQDEALKMAAIKFDVKLEDLKQFKSRRVHG